MRPLGVVCCAFLLGGLPGCEAFFEPPNGMVLRSMGAGRAWYMVGPQRWRYDAVLDGVWGSSTWDVYAVGSKPDDRGANQGLLLRSIDLGLIWREQATAPQKEWPPLAGVWGTSAHDVFVVGDKGTVLHRDGRHAPFQPQRSGTDKTLAAVWGSSSAHVVAVGHQVIVHTLDGGRTWSAQDTGILLGAVWGFSRNDIYAVGLRYAPQPGPSQGVIVHSADGGRTWSAPDPGPDRCRYFNGVWGSGPDDVYVVGTDGTLLHSADGGRTWRQRKTCSDSDLMSVWGQDRTWLVVAAADGVVCRSQDQGVTWSRVPWNGGSILLGRHHGAWGTPDGTVFLVGRTSWPSENHIK